jgi:antitoxin SocA-like protein
MKLVKVVYLSDRESIGRRGLPVVGGVYLSMRNGPVTSEILDLINSGSLWSCETTWEQFISARRNYEIELTHDPGTEHVSEFELDLIAQIFSEHEKKISLPCATGATLTAASGCPWKRGARPSPFSTFLPPSA